MKPIKDIPNYYIDSLGNVYSDKQGIIKPLKQMININGYKYVNLRINGKTVHKTVHRLVAETFIQNPNKYPYINHINCNKTDNNISNLEWSTPSLNMIHAKDNNLIKFAIGEKVGTSKLSESNVIDIRNLYKSGLYSHKDLSILFNVSKANIISIINRKSWKHI